MIERARNALDRRVTARWEPFFLAWVGAAMTAWTWRTWADPLIDFGREVYVPWRLLAGEGLYTDLAYFNGPLSPYLNALWFALFGVGIRTLILANLAILAAITLLVFRLLALVSDRFTALVATSAFLVGPAFMRTNYNFVLPYSHELTHGILLLLLGCLCLHRFSASRGEARWAFATGLCVGGAVLTKPEVVLASGAILVGFGLSIRVIGLSGRAALRRALLLGGGAVIPIVGAAVVLGVTIGPAATWGGLVDPWRMAMDSRITALPFYRRIMGLAPFWWNLAIMGYALAAIGLLAMPPILFVRLRGRREIGAHEERVASRTALTVLGGGGLALGVFAMVPFLSLSRAQPLLVLCLLAWATHGLRASSGNDELARAWVLRITLLLLAFLMTLKMLFATGVFHYGFALAMPGTVMLIVAALGWIPGEARRRGWDGELLRYWVLGVCVAIAGLQLNDASPRIELKSTAVGAGPDRIMTEPRRGAGVARALEVVRANMPEGGTLLVLPEGVTLNYLLRMETPTPFLNFMPPEVIHFGEARMLGSLRQNPPDLVLLVHKDLREYGVGLFGEGYARDLLDWVRAEYRTIERIGDPPLREFSLFGIEVLRRATR